MAVGIDAKNGKVSVKGWTEESALTALDLARRAEDAGAGTIIYTDIATDGMMAGPNFAETEKMLGALRCQLIASGGVSSVADVQRLAANARTLRVHHRQSALRWRHRTCATSRSHLRQRMPPSPRHLPLLL